MRGSIVRDVHLSLRTNLAPLANTKLGAFFRSFLLAVTMRLIVLPIEEEDMEALIKANNDNLLDSFKGFLEQTVSQIKQSNEESVESQTKEIKRHTFN